MSVRLFHHKGRTSVLPPRELVDVQVEVTPNHWYWLGEFFDDGLDRAAVIAWAPPAENTQTFIVARLLWCWENDGLGIKRLQLENTCGLATCINPTHWRYIRAVVPGVVMLPEDADAHLVQYSKLDIYGNHKYDSVHIVRNDSTYAVCGVATKNLSSTNSKTVSCKACVAEWRSSGAMLVEVKPP